MDCIERPDIEFAEVFALLKYLGTFPCGVNLHNQRTRSAVIPHMLMKFRTLKTAENIKIGHKTKIEKM